MLDETIKQIVLKFKVDDQANVSEISKHLNKLNESMQKSIPTKEASEFLKISEKIGGEFQKVAQSMNNMRMVQLKGDLRDINTQMGELQRQLHQVDQQVKSSALGGDREAYMSASTQRDQLMGQMATLGGRQQAVSGAVGGGGGFMSRNAGRVIAGAQTVSAVGGMYGGYEALEGYKTQALIENKLSRIESYASDLRRAQENTYGGNVLRAYYDARFSDMATRMAVANVTGQRREMFGQTVGAEARVGGAAVEGAMTGGLQGLPGGATGMAVGAVAGGVGAAGNQALSAERLRFQLSQFDQSRRAEVMDKRREYLDRLAASAPDRVMMEYMFNQAPSRARIESTMGFGGNVLPGLYGQALGTGVAGREDVNSALMSTRGRMSTTEQLTGIEAAVGGMGKRVGVGTLQERQGLAAGIQRNVPRIGGAQLESSMSQIQSTFEPGMQVGFEAGVRGQMSQTIMPVNPMTMAGRAAGALGAAQATGVSGQMAQEGFQRALEMGEPMAQGGTLENQIMRSSIRGAILGAGATGGMAVATENLISQMGFEEIEALPNNPQLLKALGLNRSAARQIVQRAKRAKIDTLRMAGVPEDTLRRLGAGKATQVDRMRVGLIETGGRRENISALAGRGALVEQRVSGTTGKLGGRGPGAETDNMGISRAAGEGQAALEQSISMIQQESGGAIGGAAVSQMRENLSTVEGKRAVTAGLITGQQQGMMSDAAGAKENVAQDLKGSLKELSAAIRSAASEIRQSFGSSGKVVHTR
jgi:hypothetical protein